MLKKIIRAVVPKYSAGHVVLILLQSLIRYPGRFSYRFNYANWKLYRKCSAQVMTCPVCEHRGQMFFDMPDRRLREDHGIGILRETLSCHGCGSTMRHRTLTLGLLKAVKERSGIEFRSIQQLADAEWNFTIWDTDSFSPMAQRLRRNKSYVRSEFVPSQSFGTELEVGIFNIDLQNVSFGDGSFDYVLSSDVMEHVPDDQTAHREIHRCLKKGGSYVFTVPFEDSAARNRILVSMRNGKETFLEAPHYHGDPLTGQILAYRIYGQELLADLDALGFETRFLNIERADNGVFAGDVFVACKITDVSKGHQ